MRRSAIRVIAAFLAVGFVLVAALLYPQTVAHAAHHDAHHQAAGHKTALCSWMCAAGHAVDAAAVDLSGVIDLRAIVDPAPPIQPLTTFISSTLTRAPPLAR